MNTGSVPCRKPGRKLRLGDGNITTSGHIAACRTKLRANSPKSIGKKNSHNVWLSFSVQVTKSISNWPVMDSSAAWVGKETATTTLRWNRFGASWKWNGLMITPSEPEVRLNAQSLNTLSCFITGAELIQPTGTYHHFCWRKLFDSMTSMNRF